MIAAATDVAMRRSMKQFPFTDDGAAPPQQPRPNYAPRRTRTPGTLADHSVIGNDQLITIRPHLIATSGGRTIDAASPVPFLSALSDLSGRFRRMFEEAAVDELTGLVDRLALLPSTAGDDATRVDVIAGLEKLKAAAAAAQLRVIADFAASQEAANKAMGIQARQAQRGVPEQIGLARKVSPASAARQLGQARALIDQMPASRMPRRMPPIMPPPPRVETSNKTTTAPIRTPRSIFKLSLMAY